MIVVVAGVAPVEHFLFRVEPLCALLDDCFCVAKPCYDGLLSDIPAALEVRLQVVELLLCAERREAQVFGFIFLPLELLLEVGPRLKQLEPLDGHWIRIVIRVLREIDLIMLVKINFF